MITRAEHGGAQSHVVDMIDGMRDRYEIELAVGEEGFLTRAVRSRGLPVHILTGLRRAINPLVDLRGVWQAVSLLRRVRPNLLHAHTAKAGAVGRMAARLCGVPSIYTVHMWPFGPGTPASWQYFGPAIERLAAHSTDRLITVSGCGVRAGLEYRIASASKLLTIHNGIADTVHRATPQAGPPVVAMVARFSSFKDQPTLLRAFAQALPSAPDARLLLIGEGPTRPSVEKLARELLISHRVDFMGDRDNVPQLLAKASIFVLASHLEHLPISILEAMRAGLPVIASDVGGIREAVVDKENGLVVPPKNVGALAEALELLLAFPQVRASMGQASRRCYEANFGAARMIESTMSVYAAVLHARAPVQAESAALNTVS